MTKRLLCVLVWVAALTFASSASAQVVVVGPNTVLQWDDVNTPLSTAQTLTVAATVDGGTPPITLTPVTCVAGTPVTTSTCSSLLSQIPTGSHSVTLTNASGGLVSLPSAPFSYITLLIPVPSAMRIR